MQAYKQDTITIDCDGPGFRISGGLWSGHTLYQLYREMHKRPTLQSLEAPAYEIASFEIVDLQLIRRAAATGKRLIISSGTADEKEIRCARAYPAPPQDYDLHTISLIWRDGWILRLEPQCRSGVGAARIEKPLTM